jgi:MFS family permease
MLAVGLSDELWQLLPALLLMALAWGFVYAGISTLITFQAGDHAQGGTLGVLGSASGLARVVGPLGAGFALGALGAPAPLLIGAALLGLCVLAAPLALSRTTTNLVAPASR